MFEKSIAFKGYPFMRNASLDSQAGSERYSLNRREFITAGVALAMTAMATQATCQFKTVPHRAE
jgi:hypothetical protein